MLLKNNYTNIHYNQLIHENRIVSIGEYQYDLKKDIQETILFLQIESTVQNSLLYEVQFFIQAPTVNSDNSSFNIKQALLIEPIILEVSSGVISQIEQYQNIRRSDPKLLRDIVTRKQVRPESLEDRLIELLMKTFIQGDIRTICLDFLKLLHHRKVEEILLVVSSSSVVIRNLPWEILIHRLTSTISGSDRLANDSFGIIRTTESSLNSFRISSNILSAAPLKLLFITALPESLDENSKLLEIEDEQCKLIRAIGGLEARDQPKIVIEFLVENASLAEIDKALSNRKHDIVHISGHGSFNKETKKGILFLEDEDGNEAHVTPSELGNMLSHHKSISLIILSACETAIAGEEGICELLASSSGIPAILGMRYAITDKSAKLFTTTFYERLAKGETLTTAVAEAREVLWQDVKNLRSSFSNIANAEWFTPVLYQNQYIKTLVSKNSYDESIRNNFYPQLTFLKGTYTKLIGGGFIGRRNYLNQLTKACQNQQHISLHGLGGLGKTTLSEAFSDNFSKRFGPYQIFIFRGGVEINERIILERFLSGFEMTNPDKLNLAYLKSIINRDIESTKKLQHLINNYLKGRKTIIIFDNFEDVLIEKEGIYQIEDILLSKFIPFFSKQAPKNCHLIFTSRYKISDLLDTVKHIQIDKMSYAEQYRYMNFSEVLRNIPLSQREVLHRRLDGHPRSLEYLEAFIRNNNQEEWLDFQNNLEKTTTNVFNNLLLDKLYASLSEEEKFLLHQAGFLIGRGHVDVLVAINNGQPKFQLFPIIKKLQSLSLCFWDEEKKEIEVHALTKEWLKQKKQYRNEVYKKWGLNAGKFFQVKNPMSVGEGVLAARYFEQAEEWDLFASVSTKLSQHYKLGGDYAKVLLLNKHLLEQPISLKWQSDALYEIGLVFLIKRKNKTALEYFQKSLKIAEDINYDKNKINILNNMGLLWLNTGNYDTSITYFKESYELAKKNDYLIGVGTALNSMAQAYGGKGKYDHALSLLDQSLTIKRKIADSIGEGSVLNNIANIYRLKKNVDLSLSFLFESLELVEKNKDKEGKGAVLNNIGEAYLSKNDYDIASTYLQQSFEIAKSIGSIILEGDVLNNMTRIAYHKSNYDNALSMITRTKEIYIETGDRSGECIALFNIAKIYEAQGNWSMALDLLNQSRTLAKEIGYVLGIEKNTDSINRIENNKM